MLPDACTDLVWQAGRGAFVADPDTGPRRRARRSGGVFVGARFRPGAGGAALGVPLAEVRDQRRPRRGRPRARRAVPGDLEPDEARRRIAVARTARPPDPAVPEAARRLARPGARVRPLAADLGPSERQLRRRCHAARRLRAQDARRRVLRFRRFLARATRASRIWRSWPSTDTGYADQAHLTRECTRLAGLPPAALLAAWR